MNMNIYLKKIASGHNPYLHLLTKGSQWPKENLTLLVSSVCHPWQLGGNHHGTDTVGVCL